MVTFIESGVFAQFNSIFIFLFILVVGYALLSKTKFLGDHKGINFFISLVLGVLFVTSGVVGQIFELATPWLVLFGIILLFMTITFMFMGGEAKDIPIGPTNKAMNIVVILVVLIIFALSAGEVLQSERAAAIEAGEIDEDAGVQSFPGKVAETIRHPAVLGIIITLLIATFAVMMLASAPKKP